MLRARPTLPTQSLLMVERAVTDLIRAQAMGAVHEPGARCTTDQPTPDVRTPP
jgi:hypothetical protein